MKKSYVNIILGVFLIIFLFIRPGLAQTSDELKNLRKEIEVLKESQKDDSKGPSGD